MPIQFERQSLYEKDWSVGKKVSSKDWSIQ
jgi:hypothetical protein